MTELSVNTITLGNQAVRRVGAARAEKAISFLHYLVLDFDTFELTRPMEQIAHDSDRSVRSVYRDLAGLKLVLDPVLVARAVSVVSEALPEYDTIEEDLDFIRVFPLASF